MAAVGAQDKREDSGTPGRTSAANQDAANRALGLSTGWTVFSYLISGMLAYGGIGWVIGHFTHIALLFPIGMMIGLAVSVGYVIYRYGRQ